MARGWESKAVESQQEDARPSPSARPVLSAEAQARKDKADAVALALTDATAQWQAACRAAHREALHQRVAALTALLADLRAPRS